MGFYNKDNYLESATTEGLLSEADLDKVLALYDKIDQPVRSLLELAGDISVTLLQRDLQKNHCIFGGYAVLAHLVDRFGDQFIPAWRGSDDVDIIGTEDVLHALEDRFKIKASRLNHNVNKYSLFVPGDKEETYKIDYVARQLPACEEVTVLGVPLQVMAPLPLIQSKLAPAQTQEKHRVDVIHLVGVLEDRDVSPRNVAKQLHLPQRRELYDVLQLGFDPNSRVSVGPTPAYARDLRTELLNQTCRDAVPHRAV